MKKISMLLSGAAFAAVAFSMTAHAQYSDVVGCYFYVHGQCFPAGGEPQCSEDDYNWGLDQCDQTGFEESGTRPEPGPQFAAKTTVGIKRELQQSFATIKPPTRSNQLRSN